MKDSFTGKEERAAIQKHKNTVFTNIMQRTDKEIEEGNSDTSSSSQINY